jgi:hypothetical protein
VTDTKKTSGGYFDDAMKEGAPSAKLKDKGDYVVGKIIDLFESGMTKFGTNDPVIDERTGQQRMQLVIILQTDYRNWERVAKVPTAEDGTVADPTKDEGKRAVYTPKGTNIYAALGKALKAAGAVDVEIGGQFGIVIEDLQDTGKGNKLKIHRAKYDLPVKGVKVETGDDPLAGIGAKSEEAKPETPAERPQDSKPQDEAKPESVTAPSGEVEEPPF